MKEFSYQMSTYQERQENKIHEVQSLNMPGILDLSKK